MQRRSAPGASFPDEDNNIGNDQIDCPSSAVMGGKQHCRRSQGNHCTTSNSTSKLAAFFNLFGGISSKASSNRQQGNAEAEAVERSIVGTETAASSAKDVEKLLASIQALRITSKMTAKSAESQLKGANALSKWAERTNNNAVSDVLGWTSELLRMHAERQSTFSKDYEHFLKKLGKVADTEQRVKQQQRELDKLLEREQRLAKLCTRSSCTAKLMSQRDKAVAEQRAAQRMLEEAKAESEVVKMIQLREGLMGMADAQRNLALTAAQIFACQRELAEFVPAVATKDVRQMRYNGVPLTRQRVAELKRALSTGEIPMPFNAPSSVEQRYRQQQQQPTEDLPPVVTAATVNPATNGRHHHQQQQQRAAAHQQTETSQQQQRIRRCVPLPQQDNRRRHQQPPASAARHHQQQQQQQQFVNPFGTPPPPYTPTAPPFDLLDSANCTPRRNPNRHSTSALMCHNNNAAAQQHQTQSSSSFFGSNNNGNGGNENNSSHRIYPMLPPNPFALELKQQGAAAQQRRHQQQRVRHV